MIIEYQTDDSSLLVESSPQVPSGAVMLMFGTYREVLPRVRKYLKLWQNEAEKIPNPELRKQALLSIETKTFHCEGGSIYGLLARNQIEPTIRFIVAYQTLCDYLDNLCDRIPEMKWYEFSACTGSTLGIFCLVAYATEPNCSQQLALQVKNSYFPWVQGLHILLDYLIDREEDIRGGDLNFCSYYDREREISDRFVYFFKAADRSVDRLPDRNFHRLINRALLGVYLPDRKVNTQNTVKIIARKLLHAGGRSALFFWWNGLLMDLIRYPYKFGELLVNKISIEQFAIAKIQSLHNQPQI